LEREAVPKGTRLTQEQLALSAGLDLRYKVADNGIAIDAECLTDIFKPLSRLHTASEYAGSGLGLTLARKAILAQGGAIWCESTHGSGSVFHIRLPGAVPGRRARRQRPPMLH
jgi:signal transduction histidine kinase